MDQPVSQDGDKKKDRNRHRTKIGKHACLYALIQIFKDGHLPQMFVFFTRMSGQNKREEWLSQWR